MLKLYVLPTHFKDNAQSEPMCCIFFSEVGKKNLTNRIHGSILCQYIYNHISMDSSGSSKCVKTIFNWIWAKNIFTNFLRHQLFDMALWMYCDFFLLEIIDSIDTFDFESKPWKKVSFNKYLNEAWRKIISIIHSLWL